MYKVSAIFESIMKTIKNSVKHAVKIGIIVFLCLLFTLFSVYMILFEKKHTLKLLGHTYYIEH